MRVIPQLLRVGLLIVLALGISGCTVFESKARSGLQIITGETQSIIFIDGQNLGTSPLIEKNLKPGTYQIRIEPTDASLVPYETEITLRRGLLTVLTWNPGTSPETSGGVMYEMEELKGSSDTEIIFKTDPEGAIISLEGKEKEFSPAVFTDIPPGNREFEVSLPSYAVQSHTIAVQPGFRMLITIKLAKMQQPGDMDPVTGMSEQGASELPSEASGAAVLSATTEEPQAMVRIKRTGYVVDGVEVIRVRLEPRSSSAQLKTIPAEQTYPYLGESVDNWYKIDALGTVGWVSGDFAVLELPDAP